jgi:GTP cyclohydrolase I
MALSKAAVRVIDSQFEKQPVAPLIKDLLGRLDEDPLRDGLVRTPERVAEALRFLTSGNRTDVHRLVNGALYEVEYDAMVVVKDIECFSLCEHHMLPFYGKIHVAYLPRKKVIGLSKIPRLVDMFARRLQIQERLTQQLAQTVQEVIDPPGGGGDLRGQAFLYDDARCGEAAFSRDDERHARLLPRPQGHPGRIPGAPESPRQRTLKWAHPH